MDQSNKSRLRDIFLYEIFCHVATQGFPLLIPPPRKILPIRLLPPNFYSPPLLQLSKQLAVQSQRWKHYRKTCNMFKKSYDKNNFCCFMLHVESVASSETFKNRLLFMSYQHRFYFLPLEKTSTNSFFLFLNLLETNFFCCFQGVQNRNIDQTLAKKLI